MKNQTLYLREELHQAWKESHVFELLREQQGEKFRDKEGRRTLRFVLNEKPYFLKYHAGVGWAEIIKNLLQFRMPIISARNEWLAIQRLHQLHIGTMDLAGYGERGFNPAKRESFVITDELSNTMSLEFLGEQWRRQKPSFKTKQALIRKLAAISRDMHQAGMNHRDFYLCHFLLDKSFAETNHFDDKTPVFLIDLHRTQQHRHIPSRWLIKDLGSLYFSAHQVELTRRDLYRFIITYTGLPLRKALAKPAFWQRVEQRSMTLLQKWERHQRA
jgi:heptose I phosphotransferase